MCFSLLPWEGFGIVEEEVDDLKEMHLSIIDIVLSKRDLRCNLREWV